MGDLGTGCIGPRVGDLITLGAAVSAIGCALACAVGASRLLFVLARDGVLAAPLAEVSASRGTPVIPVLALLVLGYTLYRNVFPYPTGPAAWFPVVCLVWIGLSLVVVLARRAGARLAAARGSPAAPIDARS